MWKASCLLVSKVLKRDRCCLASCLPMLSNSACAQDTSGGEEEEQAGPSSRPSSRTRRRSERRARRWESVGHHPAAPRGRGGRPLAADAWLAVSEHTPGVYVPQAGDEVVYLREGHARLLELTHNKRAAAPWHAVRHGHTMRLAEPCRLVAVRYAFAEDGSDNTLAHATLELTDEASPLKVGGGSWASELG